MGLESGLGVLIAGLGSPFIGFLPGFLVLVIPLAIPWLFMDSNSEIYVINYDDSWREKT